MYKQQQSKKKIKLQFKGSKSVSNKLTKIKETNPKYLFQNQTTTKWKNKNAKI